MSRPSQPGPPDEATCLALAERYDVPAHVVRHSKMVCGVALYLARRLQEQGLTLDAELIRAAALLHDLTKHFSFHRPLDHALTGAKVLKKQGYHRTASVVRQHVRVSASRPPGRVSEVEIVNYADKRVREDEVTTLDDRLDDIRRRYGRTPEALASLERFSAAIYQMEKEIFAVLPGGPDQIMSLNAIEECERK
ncbi:MAG: HD domain-containing protein [Thermodesulfobacteriota bacterium]